VNHTNIKAEAVMPVYKKRCTFIFYYNIVFTIPIKIFIGNQTKPYTMQVKKITTIILFGLLLTATTPALAANPVIVPIETSKPLTENDPRVQQLLDRLKQIKQVDKSSMTKTEKKELRKEVKGIRKEMKTISGGVYLSVGAIIVVILLLILIL
jgi:hypothetical protein